MKVDGHNFVSVKYEFEGVMLLFFMGDAVALVNSDGKVLMRNDEYPLFFVDFLMENLNMHKYQWN